MSILTRFLRNKRGNVATMFALSLIPLIGAVGTAVDYSRIAQVRTELGDALDAGILALGTQPPMNDTMAVATVKSWIDAHMNGVPYTLESVIQGSDQITGHAKADVQMTLARVLGVNSVTVEVTSQIMKTIGKVEIALVLDNTGSMKGKKIATLITAANQLVDSLGQATKNPLDLRISLVPFSQTVNVGSTYQNAAWIDVAGKSTSAKSLFLGREVNRFDLFKAMGTTWGGCIETRGGGFESTEGYDASDVNTLYAPYFAPDEPGAKGAKANNSYNNSYLADSPIAAILASLGLTSVPGGDVWKYLQGDILKYTGKPFVGTTKALGYDFGPNSGCEIAPLQRLTTDRNAVKKAIDAMIAQGNTDIPVGLAWGWNALSPAGPFADGKPYDDNEWTKIVVLMTDGNNENEAGNQEDESYYSGIGYIWQGRMGVTSAPKPKRTQLRDQALAAMCKNMKDAGKTVANPEDGVTIYTIRVEVKNGSSSVLEDCASDPGKFFDVQNVNNLVAVFEKIGGSIQKLRLSR